MKNISKHITYAEAIYSDSAKRKGIANIPNADELKAMELLANKVFEPLREFINKPIKISSFFRSKVVNSAIGGSTSSQHCKGEAIDLDDTYGGFTNAEMFHYIKDNLEFDQLIWEYGNNVNPDWVHVSYSKNRSRKQVLKVVRSNGQPKYLPYA